MNDRYEVYRPQLPDTENLRQAPLSELRDSQSCLAALRQHLLVGFDPTKSVYLSLSFIGVQTNFLLNLKMVTVQNEEITIPVSEKIQALVLHLRSVYWETETYVVNPFYKFSFLVSGATSGTKVHFNNEEDPRVHGLELSNADIMAEMVMFPGELSSRPGWFIDLVRG